MKFLLPNYSCIQNPWLGGCRPQIPVLSVLNWIYWPPPPNKIPGYATGFYLRRLEMRTIKVTRNSPNLYYRYMFYSFSSTFIINTRCLGRLPLCPTTGQLIITRALSRPTYRAANLSTQTWRHKTSFLVTAHLPVRIPSGSRVSLSRGWGQSLRSGTPEPRRRSEEVTPWWGPL